MGITGDRAVWEAETEGLELLNVTMGEMLDQQALRSPDREAWSTTIPNGDCNCG
jgi:hypothetical protein